MLVRDLWRQGSWFFENLATPIPDNIRNHISHIPIPMDIDCHDGWFWKGSNLGVYTVASGYNWLLPNTVEPNTVNEMTWLWKVKAPEKIKLLLWLGINNAIPTGEFRFVRNLCDTPVCQRCGQDMETILHCLRDCDMSRNIWCMLDFGDDAFFSENQTLLWFKNSIRHRPTHIFVSAIWCLWRRRNAALLEGVIWSDWYTLHMVLSYAEDILRCLSLPTHLNTWAIRDSWIAPPIGYFKLNVDGSVFPLLLRGGFGGVIRDHSGT